MYCGQLRQNLPAFGEHVIVILASYFLYIVCTFQIALAFYLDFVMEEVKSRCLISSVSAGRIKPCREQHVARELQIEEPYYKR